MCEQTTTPGGLAVDADGKQAGLPRDLVHWVNGQLFDVVTLLHASRLQVDSGPDQAGEDELTSADSRAVSLVAMADNKVREVLHAILAYV